MPFSHISFLSFTFPGAPYWIFLLFIPWLSCHFYLIVIEQQQHNLRTIVYGVFDFMKLLSRVPSLYTTAILQLTINTFKTLLLYIGINSSVTEEALTAFSSALWIPYTI